jgi:hypothetical protein
MGVVASLCWKQCGALLRPMGSLFSSVTMVLRQRSKPGLDFGQAFAATFRLKAA